MEQLPGRGGGTPVGPKDHLFPFIIESTSQEIIWTKKTLAKASARNSEIRLLQLIIIVKALKVNYGTSVNIPFPTRCMYNKMLVDISTFVQLR